MLFGEIIPMSTQRLAGFATTLALRGRQLSQCRCGCELFDDVNERGSEIGID